MTGLVTVNVQTGQSPITTQNFTIRAPADGTFRISRGNVGSTINDPIVINADNSLTCINNITGYSDLRLKTDIEVITDALDKVNALRGVMFTRIDTGERQTGLIAQDVQAVLPEAVKEGSDEHHTLSLAYGNLAGLLVEAIKELSAASKAQAKLIEEQDKIIENLTRRYQ